MSTLEHEDFYEEYTQALREGTAALFAGAGLSVPAGYVDWKSLLRPLAQRLGMDVEQEPDLPALAQFAVNAAGGRRTRVSQRILADLTRETRLTPSHELLARLPIRTVWTTNYDGLLERAFSEAGKRCDVKRQSTSLALTTPDADVTVYKMHGDVTDPGEVVLTKDDYESYSDSRQLFSTLLQAELATKTFLFLGFSFNDTNLGHILSLMRRQLKDHARTHFWIEKRKGKDGDPERRRQEHQAANLRRYGIQCVLIDDYAEIPRMLGRLQERMRSNNVFISGAVADPGRMGQARLEQFSMALSAALVRKGHTVFSGSGRGLGESVYAGAFQVSRAREPGRGRLELRPMPRGLPEKERRAAYTDWRQQIIRQTGFTLILCGNKRTDAGELIVGEGIWEEFRIAVKEASRPIPVVATGLGAAASGVVDIWNEMKGKLETYYPEGGVKPFFQVLKDPRRSDDELIQAIFGIMARVNQPR